MNKKDIRVGRLLLVTCFIFQANILAILKINTYTFKHLTNLKTFSKDQHLCIHSYCDTMEELT